MSYGSTESTHLPARSVPGTSPRPLRVLLLDASAERAALIENALDGLRPDVIVQHVSSPAEFERGIAESAPDVLLVDRALARARGASEFARMRALRPAAPLIFIASALDETSVRELLHDMPDDVVTVESLNRLCPAIEAGVTARKSLAALSPRQLETLVLVAEGRSTREIAERLGLSVKTVESHRGAMMKRLGLPDVAGLVRHAVHMGLVRADGYYPQQ